MSTNTLGALSFFDTPDVNGDLVLTEVTGLLQGVLTGTANQIAIGGTNAAPSIGLASNIILPGTAGFLMPKGTTAQRPTTPTVGVQRYNTDNAEPEIYSNGAWIPGNRVVQVLSGNIAGTAASVTTKTTATVPLSTEGLQMWTTPFTPLVIGSNLVIQFTVTVYTAGSARNLLIAIFNGTTCIGTTAVSVIPATATAGHYNVALQAVVPVTSTAALTIQARLIPYLSTANTAVSVGFNQMTGGTINFGTSMATEWRILEMIP